MVLDLHASEISACKADRIVEHVLEVVGSDGPRLLLATNQEAITVAYTSENTGQPDEPGENLGKALFSLHWKALGLLSVIFRSMIGAHIGRRRRSSPAFERDGLSAGSQSLWRNGPLSCSGRERQIFGADGPALLRSLFDLRSSHLDVGKLSGRSKGILMEGFDLDLASDVLRRYLSIRNTKLAQVARLFVTNLRHRSR